MERVRILQAGHRRLPFINRRMIHTCDLLNVLVARDIKLRYKRSVIGAMWTLLNPLAELLVLLFIFKVVLPLNIPNYLSFLFTGIVTYSWFQSSLFFAANAIVGNRDLVKQPGFPPAILPVVTVTSNLVHFVMSFPVLFIFLLLNDVRPTRALLLLPFLIALQFILTLSLAYMVAASHVRFRDTQYLLRLVLQFLFYLSPIFYPASEVPAHYQWLYNLNPFVFLIDAYRAVLIRGEYPNYEMLLAFSVLFTVLLFLGMTVFKRTSHRFVEELG